MKLLVSTLLSLVLVVCSVRGYRIVDADDISNHIDDEICTLADTDSSTRLVSLVRSQQLCVHPSPEFLQRLVTATTLDANKQIFKNVCSKVPQTRACVAEASSQRDACLTAGVERSMFDVFTDVVGTGLDELCYNEGERLALFFGKELKSFTLANEHRVLSCFHAMIANAVFKDVHDYQAFSMKRYASFKSLKQCIGNVAQSQGIETESFNFIVNTLLETSKCISKDTGNLVLCKDVTSE